jgi:hypothetical protein
MTKIRRGGDVLVSWIGDHSPKHVHVYRDGELVVKWDLENWRSMKGTASRQLLGVLRDLLEEGLL